jgi:hypothetical protein
MSSFSSFISVVHVFSHVTYHNLSSFQVVLVPSESWIDESSCFVFLHYKRDNTLLKFSCCFGFPKYLGYLTSQFHVFFIFLRFETQHYKRGHKILKKNRASPALLLSKNKVKVK